MAEGTGLIDDIGTRIRLTRVCGYRLVCGGQDGVRRVIYRLLDADPLIVLFRAP
jgi:hypothetical protein